ncbi:hypothetical protein PYCC9005_002859 [Savitreella phatthalungensis]
MFAWSDLFRRNTPQREQRPTHSDTHTSSDDANLTPEDRSRLALLFPAPRDRWPSPTHLSKAQPLFRANHQHQLSLSPTSQPNDLSHILAASVCLTRSLPPSCCYDLWDCVAGEHVHGCRGRVVERVDSSEELTPSDFYNSLYLGAGQSIGTTYVDALDDDLALTHYYDGLRLLRHLAHTAPSTVLADALSARNGHPWRGIALARRIDSLEMLTESLGGGLAHYVCVDGGRTVDVESPLDVARLVRRVVIWMLRRMDKTPDRQALLEKAVTLDAIAQLADWLPIEVVARGLANVLSGVPGWDAQDDGDVVVEANEDPREFNVLVKDIVNANSPPHPEDLVIIDMLKGYGDLGLQTARQLVSTS